VNATLTSHRRRRPDDCCARASRRRCSGPSTFPHMVQSIIGATVFPLRLGRVRRRADRARPVLGERGPPPKAGGEGTHPPRPRSSLPSRSHSRHVRS
jgi:hypothetical protein